MSKYELELWSLTLMPFGLSKCTDILCFDTEQCIVEFSTGKIEDCTRLIMGLNPQNLSKASNTIVCILMKALGFHIFMESYIHLSPNVDLHVPNKDDSFILFQFNTCSN